MVHPKFTAFLLKTRRFGKTALVVMICLLLLPVRAWGASSDFDSGPITAIDEGIIYVTGNKGEHSFEPIADCTWCEVGMEVSIRFHGVTRATLKAFNDPTRLRPVQTFIVKDGREG